MFPTTCVYDSNGARVKAIENGVTNVYIGDYYKRRSDAMTSTEVKYYSANGQRIAMRTNGTLTWLLGDHLGSTTITANADGTLASGQTYTAWGETRSGTLPADRQYTGQISEPQLGIYFYNSRYYDPYITQFTQPDSIIQDPNNPLDWNRYMYVRNNPINSVDPDGHRACIDVNEKGQCVTDPLWYSERDPKGFSVSPEVIDFIKGWEEFQPNLYDNDGGGNCTIGYGHLVHIGKCNGSDSENDFEDGITQDEAEKILREDINKVKDSITEMIDVKIKQNEFDALVSFTFNVGLGYGIEGDVDVVWGFSNSMLLEVLNLGAKEQVPSELMRWIYPLSAPGLKTRRDRESIIFLLGFYDSTH